MYKPLPIRGQGGEPSTSNFFSEFSGSGSYTDGFAYTSGVSVSGGGGGGLFFGGPSNTVKHVAFGKISALPPSPAPRGSGSGSASHGNFGGRGGGGGTWSTTSLRRTASLPENNRATYSTAKSGGLPPVDPSRRTSTGYERARQKSTTSTAGATAGRASGMREAGGRGGDGDDESRRDNDAHGGAPGAQPSIRRRGMHALSDPTHTEVDEVEMMQLKQDLEEMGKTDMGKEERRRLYQRTLAAERRHGKVTANGALDQAAVAASTPKLSASQEEAARRYCPPRDPRLINPEDSSDSEDGAGEEAEGRNDGRGWRAGGGGGASERERDIGAHRDRDWRPIAAKACMALERIHTSLAALDETTGPDPAMVAASKEGLPEPVTFAADGVTPLVFKKEQDVDYDADYADEDPKTKASRGNLVEKLLRDASSEEASAEEKALILQRMLDAASVHEGETAKALARMERLMHAMCLSEADKGVAAATSTQIKRATALSVVGLSMEDEEMSLADAVSAVRTITVTTGDLSFDMFRSIISRLVPQRLVSDHVFCSLYLDARSSAGRITSKTFKEAAMTVMEMDHH